MLRSLLNRWLHQDVRSRRRKSSHAEAREDRTLLATLTVNQPLDIVASDGLLSLREAVTAVNTETLLCHNVPGQPGCDGQNSPVTIPLGPGPHVIQLPAVSGMILVGGPLTMTSSSDITIQGHGAASSGINSPTSAIFDLQGGNVTLAAMTLSGFTIGDGGAVSKVANDW